MIQTQILSNGAHHVNLQCHLLTIMLLEKELGVGHFIVDLLKCLFLDGGYPIMAFTFL
jgi:hypothetical protein